MSLVEQSVLPSVAAAVIGGTSIMGGRGGYSGTIVGALILTVLTTLLTVLEMPEAVRQVLFGAIIVAVAAAYTRVTGEIVTGPDATHHLGIDLGVTNLKWAVVERDGDDWRTLDRGQRPDAGAGGPGRRHRPGRRDWAGRRSSRWPAIASVGHRRPRAVRPGRPARPDSSSTCPGEWAGRPVAGAGRGRPRRAGRR